MLKEETDYSPVRTPSETTRGFFVSRVKVLAALLLFISLVIVLIVLAVLLVQQKGKQELVKRDKVNATAKGSGNTSETDLAKWNSWKTLYSKMYKSDTEEAMRYAIWKDNRRKIQQHNSEGHSYTLAMNQFSDMTVGEYRFFLGNRFRYTNETKPKGSFFRPPSAATLPPTVNWTARGYVTPVKNEGRCGACWAFSTTGSVEGQHFNKTGKLVSLSEQNLIDCSTPYGTHGCDGGFMNGAFTYIKENGGIETEASYPYKAKQGKCHFKASNVGATITGFENIRSESEADLQSATATVGPISIAIEAGHDTFQHYKSGVYNEPSCSSTVLDHAVLVVGYGTYKDQDYWLVKNSWGTSWGMQGYIMMSRNKNNQCGIATSASFPLV